MVIVLLQEWWGLVGNEFAALMRSHQWAQAQVRPPPPSLPPFCPFPGLPSAHCFYCWVYMWLATTLA